MNNSFFNTYFQSINNAVALIDSKILIKVAELIKTVSRNSKKIIIVGNGGSSAIASHVSVDLTKAAKVRAINFNEAALITCFANDYGYEKWVSEALSAYADKGDLAILISSSGKSPNILNGALKAKELGLEVVTLSGFNSENPLRKLADIELWADSSDYNVVETTHQIWLLAIIDYVIASQR
jgi:D-sedoheptulose 7-phosphate isomerase